MKNILKVCKEVDTNNWKKENAIRKRNAGEGYVSRRGKAIPLQGAAHLNALKCLMLSNKQDTIFTEFWSVGDKQKQETLHCFLRREEGSNA
ncbi:hypothetical protein PR048_018901 [Dryococelus australis]|uniref:Uncharacterized protein n=1 Tax=Dryococelus australis TaxID=614101 RepID=A0ABQ9H1Y4_9NEOP|nr:hypothetical protein PR048_018901 [Dryococelus australis]